eukprot:scaffold795_cov164-Ochromonas_danica.AAC.4
MLCCCAAVLQGGREEQLLCCELDLDLHIPLCFFHRIINYYYYNGNESEPVNPMVALTEACKPKCTVQWEKYQACIPRIEKAKEGDCEAWYFDFYKCLDKCRVPESVKYVK